MLRKLLSSKLAKSTSIYTLSTFINSAIPFLLLPILTRYLTTEEYGILSMFNATTAFLIPFAGLSIGSGIQRKMVDRIERETKEYIYNSLIIFIIASLAVSLLLFLFHEPVSKYTAIPSDLLVHVMVFTVSSTICSVWLSFLQFNEQTKSYAVFRNAETALNVLLSMLLVVAYRMSLRGRVYGIAFSKLIFAIVAGGCLFRYIKGNHSKLNKAYIKDELLNYAIPMIPTEIKSTVLTYMDRIFLINMINAATTGIYSLGNQVSLPLLFLEQSFNLAWVPWLFKKLKDGKEGDKRKIVKITYVYFVTAPVIAVLWSIISKPVIGIIGGEKYADACRYVIWLSLGYAFVGMQMMVVNFIYYVKKLNLYMIVTVAVMVLNIVLNYILITANGSVGAAQATAICNVVSFLFTWILSIRVCPMPWLSVFRSMKKKIIHR